MGTSGRVPHDSPPVNTTGTLAISPRIDFLEYRSVHAIPLAGRAK
ncbi:hypothetical protein STRIP9103_03391, partial [Streptomyces ipomoeae 91-03]